MIKNPWASTRIGQHTTWLVRTSILHSIVYIHLLFNPALLLFLPPSSPPPRALFRPSSQAPKDLPLTSSSTEEHHISNFDPGSFFLLHDYDGSLTWTPAEITRTYGLDDESAKDVPQEKRQEVVKGVLEKFDFDGDGMVTREEWFEGWEKGNRLPDFGVSWR